MVITTMYESNTKNNNKKWFTWYFNLTERMAAGIGIIWIEKDTRINKLNWPNLFLNQLNWRQRCDDIHGDETIQLKVQRIETNSHKTKQKCNKKLKKLGNSKYGSNSKHPIEVSSLSLDELRKIHFCSIPNRNFF